MAQQTARDGREMAQSGHPEARVLAAVDQLRTTTPDAGPIHYPAQRQRGGAYSSGLSDINSGKYDQAITLFDQAIAQKGTRTDAALYWKAYAQYRLGKSDDALATLAELRQSYAQSRYLGDSRVLEADAKKSSGKPLTGDADDDEIKLLAISLQNNDPEGAVPLLENVLKATNSLQVKKRALFVLASNDQPAAHQILVSYAKGSGNPDLQVEAIRYLARSARRPDAELRRSTTRPRTSTCGARSSTRSRTRATRPRSSGHRRAGRVRPRCGARHPRPGQRQHGHAAGTDAALPEGRGQGAAAGDGARARLDGRGGPDDAGLKTEKEPAVRQQAIRSLGNKKTERTGQALIELYAAQTDKDVRKAVISALGNQNNADGLISIARKETNSELKLEIVRRIADIAPKQSRWRRTT